MKLSVIIPLYNAEIYIKEALDSLFAQKGMDIEWRNGYLRRF